jgi:hypothetical protein
VVAAATAAAATGAVTAAAAIVAAAATAGNFRFFPLFRRLENRFTKKAPEFALGLFVYSRLRIRNT